VTHYVTPEFFSEPTSPDSRSAAVLGLQDGKVVGAVTGSINGKWMRCGNADRPQLAISREAVPEAVLSALEVGLRQIVRDNALKGLDLTAWTKLPWLRQNGFLEHERTGVVMLDLTRDPQALFREFSSNKKTNIKKAIKKGVVVEATSDPADIREYFPIYRGWSVRKNLPFKDLDWFQDHLALTNNRKLFVARFEGKMLAGVIVRFAAGAVVEYSANSSIEESLYLRPNDLLHWRVIEWACGAGFRYYSLAGSHMFLRKFGGHIQPTYQYCLDRTLLRRHLLAHISRNAATRLRQAVPLEAVEMVRRLGTQLLPGRKGLRKDSGDETQ